MLSKFFDKNFNFEKLLFWLEAVFYYQEAILWPKPDKI